MYFFCSRLPSTPPPTLFLFGIGMRLIACLLLSHLGCCISLLGSPSLTQSLGFSFRYVRLDRPMTTSPRHDEISRLMKMARISDDDGQISHRRRGMRVVWMRPGRPWWGRHVLSAHTCTWNNWRLSANLTTSPLNKPSPEIRSPAAGTIVWRRHCGYGRELKG